MRCIALLLVFAVAACGDEGGGGGAKPPPKPAAKAAKKPDKKILLNVYPKVEDRVAVNERPTIRHPFRERDFASDPSGTENRDPFRSYVIAQPGGALTSAGAGSVEPTTFCTRKEQMVASNYNLRDLRLVGIVTRGPKKYALFQDTGDVGRIVHRGDCLGREKARVKDIGSGFVTLEIIPEQVPNQPPRPNEERSIPLYPEELKLGERDDEGGGPAVTPPAMPPSAPSGQSGPVMPAEQPPAPAPTQPAPAPAPAPPPSK